MDSLIQTLPDSTRIIELEMGTINPEKQSFMINTIARIAGKYNRTASLESGDVKIALEKMELKPVYNEETSKLFGINKNLTRQLNILVSGYIQEKNTGAIFDTFDVKKQFSDVVSASEIPEIEKSPYSFTRGTVENKLKWTKYIEPGILIASVSALIYLFYSMRY